MAIYKDGKLVITKGLSIPDAKGGSGRISPAMLAAKEMEVGDSIAIPYGRKAMAGNMARVSGFKFTQRTVIEEDQKMLRIWRIE